MADVEALAEAIRVDDVSAVDRLLAAEPQLASSRDRDGLTPVILARYWSKPDIVERLLAIRGDNLDVFEATIAGRPDLVRAHLARDPALAGAWTQDGYTALHYAAFFGGADAAEALIDAGADLEAVSRNGMGVRPLNSAAAGRHGDVARLLVERGADVNAAQEQGFRPLHAAAQNGDADLVAVFLAAGADTNARLDDGRTAADVALEAGHQATAELLGGPSPA
jgi:ankyrin repeat protein